MDKIKEYQQEIKRLQRLVKIHTWCKKFPTADPKNICWFNERRNELDIPLEYISTKERLDFWINVMETFKVFVFGIIVCWSIEYNQDTARATIEDLKKRFQKVN